MFDVGIYANLRRQAEHVAAGREHTGLGTGPQVCDALRDVQKALDILDGVRADLLARLQACEAYADEGASTTAGWARQQLRMGVGESRRLRKAGDTLHLLPAVAEALARGRIRAEHVDEFTAGVTKLGATVMADLEEILLPVAEDGTPADVRAVITELHHVLHADELDKKYARGMDRRDLAATRCGDGFHLTGFLDQHTGAKLVAWLKTMSRPEYDGDDRTPAARRVDALARLLDTHAAPGDNPPDQTRPDQTRPDQTSSDQTSSDQTPSDQTPPPGRGPRRADTRLLVLADLETLLRLPGAAPATLAGFGPIGDQLLGYLTCTGDLTALLTHGTTTGPIPQANILNVGRTHRLATRAQRDAILARQDATCANPGCGSTLLEFHHVDWWHRDHGTTNLANLVGICSACHHLVHQNKLTIRPDGHGGFTFHRTTGAMIDDHTRITKHRIRTVITQIRRAATTDNAEPPPTPPPTPPQRRPPKREQRPRFDPSWLTPIDNQKTTADHHLYQLTTQHHT